MEEEEEEEVDYLDLCKELLVFAPQDSRISSAISKFASYEKSLYNYIRVPGWSVWILIFADLRTLKFVLVSKNNFFHIGT